MRLRPGLALLWRDTTSVQVGTDPRWASVIADLTPAATRALHAAGPGAALSAVAARLDEAGVGGPERRAVLDTLTAARHLVAESPGAGVDAVAWGLVSPDGRSPDGRARAVVEVHGLGRLGTQLAHHLATAGVGTVVPVDARPVDAADLGVGGIAARDLGNSRHDAVARALHDARPRVRTRAPGVPDIVVTIEHGAADPVTARELVADGIAHLSVVVREASVLVGPLVRPGGTSCLRCLDLHRTAADPTWPTIAAQLCARGSRLRQEETLLAAAGAAATASAVLAHLDSRAGLTDRYLVLALPDALGREVPAPPHPDCGCLDLP